MTVNFGNGFHFMYVCIALTFGVLLYLVLRKRKERTIRIVLLSILFANFALHFLKLAFKPYIDNIPYALCHASVENICAGSTVFFPFIFLIKKQNVLHDYMFFIGVCGGLGALIYPTEALGEPAFSFDVFRFFFCHIILIVVPIVSALLGINRPKLKNFWAIPLVFLAQEAIICLNEIVLIKTGIVKHTWAQFFDRGSRNCSFVFGIDPSFDSLRFMFDPLVPNFFKTDAFHINGGTPFYFPVLWLIVPAFAYLIPCYIIFSSPFWIYDLVKSRKQKTQPKVPKMWFLM